MRQSRVSGSSYDTRPPIFVNSLPKSGTHLLLQITQALPQVQYYGRFIATSPSLTQKVRSDKQLSQMIEGVLPNETLGAHLHYSEAVASAMLRVKSLHLFIYRDPRDVLFSEINYLTRMNRWHRMHKHFRNLPNEASRLKLGLDGYDDRYPEANSRLLPYAPWLNETNTLAIRYEDLSGPSQREIIDQILTLWRSKTGATSTPDGLAASLVASISPEKSHTFHKGGSGRWKVGLTDEEIRTVNRRLSPALRSFGYDV